MWKKPSFMAPACKINLDIRQKKFNMKKKMIHIRAHMQTDVDVYVYMNQCAN